MNSNLIETASFINRYGFKIHPSTAGSKTPVAGIKWQHESSSEPVQIKQWASTHNTENFGILIEDGFCVVDLDLKNGKDGYQALTEIVSTALGVKLNHDNQGYVSFLDGLDDFDTLTVSTPSGGIHYYFLLAGNYPTRHFDNGIDFLTANSRVMAPGSVIDGKEYMVINDNPLKPLPDYLLDTFYHPKTELQEHHEAVGGIEELDELLSQIDPDLPYSAWIKCIFAACRHWGQSDETYESLAQWSSEGRTWDLQAFNKAFHSYKPDHHSPAQIGTLHYYAAQYPSFGEERFTDSLPEAQDYQELSRQVYELTRDRLIDRGNKPDEKHLADLHLLSEGMVRCILSDDKFRLAFPLFTGFGKTTTISSLIHCLRDTSFSLVVTAEMVDQLHDLRNDCIELGVPEEKIGIFHGSESKYPDIPSLEVDEVEDNQFLLITHNRIKSPKFKTNRQSYLTFNDQKRNLLIWDESMIATNGETLQFENVSKAISEWHRINRMKTLQGKTSPHPERIKDFVDFLDASNKLIEDKLSNKQETLFELPVLFMEDNEAKQMVNLHFHTGTKERETLYKLCNWALRTDGQVRVIQAGSEYSAIQFVSLIDDEVDKVVILDASAEIKNLMKLDDSIKVVRTQSEKDHRDVTIYWGNVKSSRTAIENDLFDEYIDEICHLVKNEIPNDEEVLIFHFKQRGVNFIDRLKNEFYSQGISLSRIKLLSWGQHKASNAYSHIKYVICYGFMRRDKADIRASVVAQTGDMKFNLTNDIVNDALYSEMSDMLFQGLSRCNCRYVNDGDMTAYLFLPKRDKAVLDSLKTVMPNVSIEEYDQKYLPEYRKADNTDGESLGETICELMDELPDDIHRMTFNKLRKEILVEPISRSTWNSARHYAENNLVGWNREGNTFVRC